MARQRRRCAAAKRDLGADGVAYLLGHCRPESLEDAEYLRVRCTEPRRRQASAWWAAAVQSARSQLIHHEPAREDEACIGQQAESREEASADRAHLCQILNYLIFSNDARTGIPQAVMDVLGEQIQASGQHAEHHQQAKASSKAPESGSHADRASALWLEDTPQAEREAAQGDVSLHI